MKKIYFLLFAFIGIININKAEDNLQGVEMQIRTPYDYIDMAPSNSSLELKNRFPYTKDGSTIDLGKCANVYNFLNIPYQKLLSFDPKSGLLAFIHRGGNTKYTSAQIAVDFSRDSGKTWFIDTLLIADNSVRQGNNGNRYPSVTILNKNGSTSMDDAFVVAVGASLANNNAGTNGWNSTYYASMKLDGSNHNVQYLNNSLQAVDASKPGTPNDFYSTLTKCTDTTVFSISSTVNLNANAPRLDTVISNIDYYLRKGTLGKGDTLKWEVVDTFKNKYYFVQLSTGRFSNASSYGLVAFSPSGKVGYYVNTALYKSDKDTINSKRFFISKTTDYGNSWTDLGYPNFTNLSEINSRIPERLRGNGKDYYVDDFSITVDANDSLHIFCLLSGQYSNIHNKDKDSLGFLFANPTQSYAFAITFIDTFAGNQNAYLIDSMEVVDFEYGTRPNNSFIRNRPTTSRTKDGKKVFYMYADTDPLIAQNRTIGNRSYPSNSDPDGIIIGKDITTNKWTAAKVLTENTDAFQLFKYGFYSNTVINKGNAVFELPTGFVELTGLNPLGVASGKYLEGITINNSEFNKNSIYNNTLKGLKNTKGIEVGVTIYPNPSKDIFNIDFDKNRDYMAVKVNVMDMLGRIVYTNEYKSDSNIKVDLSDHSDGIYFMKIQNKYGFISKKIILAR